MAFVHSISKESVEIMSIRKLDQEIQERIHRAIKSLKLPDPDDYRGTAEREYRKELARILQKEGNKAANASTDQLIAGKLKAVGYGLDEIEEVIKNNGRNQNVVMPDSRS